MLSITETVFDTRDNIALVLFKQDGIAFNFIGATRFILTLGITTVDTNITPAAITITGVAGQLKFDLGGLGLPLTKNAATLVVFDAAHPNGQILACSKDKLLVFDVKTC